MGRMKDRMIDVMNEENDMLGKKKIEKIEKNDKKKITEAEEISYLEAYEKKLVEIDKELDKIAREEQPILLGDQVKDTLTDLEGTAVARTVYLHGCPQYEVQPRQLKDGKVVDSAWIDEPQLVVVRKKSVQRKIKSRYDPKNHGGVRSHP